jgi:HAD superfamily hydrolase (TIGR01509 family)
VPASSPTLIFDCDGVLVDSEIIYCAVETEFLAEIGLTYDPVEYDSRFKGLNGRDYMAAVRQDYATRYSDPFPGDFADRLYTEMYRRMENELQVIDGIHALLGEHRGPRAVASSSALDRLHWKLAKTKLAAFFGEHVFSGEQVENGKPAPDLFLKAAGSLGTAPEDCIVIEDSRNGVKAGVAAGMTVWGFTGGGHTLPGLSNSLREAGAQQVMSSFGEMAACLQNMTNARS